MSRAVSGCGAITGCLLAALSGPVSCPASHSCSAPPVVQASLESCALTAWLPGGIPASVLSAAHPVWRTATCSLTCRAAGDAACAGSREAGPGTPGAGDEERGSRGGWVGVYPAASQPLHAQRVSVIVMCTESRDEAVHAYLGVIDVCVPPFCLRGLAGACPSPTVVMPPSL